MARAEKQAAVAEIVDSFNDAAGAVLTEYRGLTVKQLQELRRALGENANYAVVKNTLTKIAAKEAGVDGFDDLLCSVVNRFVPPLTTITIIKNFVGIPAGTPGFTENGAVTVEDPDGWRVVLMPHPSAG